MHHNEGWNVLWNMEHRQPEMSNQKCSVIYVSFVFDVSGSKRDLKFYAYVEHKDTDIFGHDVRAFSFEMPEQCANVCDEDTNCKGTVHMGDFRCKWVGMFSKLKWTLILKPEKCK